MSKEKFVKDKLSPLMTECCTDVLGAVYEKVKQNEYVTVFYTDGHILKVNVAGDSLYALTLDVLNKIDFY